MGYKKSDSFLAWLPIQNYGMRCDYFDQPIGTQNGLDIWYVHTFYGQYHINKDICIKNWDIENTARYDDICWKVMAKISIFKKNIYTMHNQTELDKDKNCTLTAFFTCTCNSC